MGGRIACGFAPFDHTPPAREHHANAAMALEFTVSREWSQAVCLIASSRYRLVYSRKTRICVRVIRLYDAQE